MLAFCQVDVLNEYDDDYAIARYCSQRAMQLYYDAAVL